MEKKKMKYNERKTATLKSGNSSHLEVSPKEEMLSILDFSETPLSFIDFSKETAPDEVARLTMKHPTTSESFSTPIAHKPHLTSSVESPLGSSQDTLSAVQVPPASKKSSPIPTKNSNHPRLVKSKQERALSSTKQQYPNISTANPKIPSYLEKTPHQKSKSRIPYLILITIIISILFTIGSTIVPYIQSHQESNLKIKHEKDFKTYVTYNLAKFGDISCTDDNNCTITSTDSRINNSATTLRSSYDSKSAKNLQKTLYTLHQKMINYKNIKGRDNTYTLSFQTLDEYSYESIIYTNTSYSASLSSYYENYISLVNKNTYGSDITLTQKELGHKLKKFGTIASHKEIPYELEITNKKLLRDLNQRDKKATKLEKQFVQTLQHLDIASSSLHVLDDEGNSIGYLSSYNFSLY